MDNELQTNYTTEQTYHSIRHSIVSAQRSLCTAVNSAMVTAYWEIGEQIYKACGENDRAGYGKKLNTTRVSNFFIGTRVVSYSESLALQGVPLLINNPDAS